MTQHEAILIFDGDCSFCTSTANYVVKKSQIAIQAHPWQFIDVSKYGLTQQQTQDRVYFVLDGKKFGGHQAFAKIMLIQGNWLYKIAGALLMYPPFSFFARPGYRLIAKYRHKMPGGTPACQMPPKKAN